MLYQEIKPPRRELCKVKHCFEEATSYGYCLEHFLMFYNKTKDAYKKSKLRCKSRTNGSV